MNPILYMYCSQETKQLQQQVLRAQLLLLTHNEYDKTTTEWCCNNSSDNPNTADDGIDIDKYYGKRNDRCKS